MTAREFATAIGKPYPTVALWLRQQRVPGAYQEKVGDFGIWQVPVEAVKRFEPPKQGRPKKAAAVETAAPAASVTATAAQPKKAAGKGTPSAVKTKPAKKRAAKKGAK